jgi:magnesium-transporting ATPase (P-type)
MRPDSVRLKRFHRYLLYFVLALLFLSGIGWAWFNYFATLPNKWQSSSKSFAMKIHGAAAMAILVLIGTLLNGHVRYAWRAKRNRINGAFFIAVFAVLTLTGYGLYYAGGETLRAWTSWIHLWTGLVFPIFLIVHVLLGKKTRPLVPRRHHHSPPGSRP